MAVKAENLLLCIMVDSLSRYIRHVLMRVYYYYNKGMSEKVLLRSGEKIRGYHIDDVPLGESQKSEKPPVLEFRKPPIKNNQVFRVVQATPNTLSKLTLKELIMTKARILPSQEILNELLRYDPETGDLQWKERKKSMFSAECYCTIWNKRFSGKMALANINNAGYKNGCIDRVGFLAHRVIYKLVHGVDADFIDHINQDRTDNKITNLRSVSKLENNRNTKINKNNTSGCMGVYFSKAEKKWKAAITINYRNIGLGTFINKEDAITERKKAEQAHGFHVNHGTISQ